MVKMNATQIIKYTKVVNYNAELPFDSDSQGYQRKVNPASKKIGNVLDKNLKQHLTSQCLQLFFI